MSEIISRYAFGIRHCFFWAKIPTMLSINSLLVVAVIDGPPMIVKYISAVLAIIGLFVLGALKA